MRTEIVKQLAALDKMTAGELKNKYQAVFGEGVFEVDDLLESGLEKSDGILPVLVLHIRPPFV